MRYQLLLVVFLINFLKIATGSEANLNSFKNIKNLRDDSDIDDTPSPEWIKYQQERFQDSDKLNTKHQQIIKNKVEPKTQPDSKLELSKMKISSRQEGSHQDDVKQANFKDDNSKDSQEYSADEMSSTVELPSIQGFIEFVKSLKQTWMKTSLFRFEDKIKMLHRLKDSLLKTIENQFMILWQEDEDDADHIDTTVNPKNARKLRENKRGSPLRSKRGILDESNIHFPPDAALMSINFLTFAVFLIKLVLQVVNIVKTKHYQFTTLNMDSGAIRNG